MFLNSNYVFSISRDAELEADDGFLIGPPPPAMVAEAASANEAERFEEVHFQRHFHFRKISSNVFQYKNVLLYFEVPPACVDAAFSSYCGVYSTLFPDSYS